MRGHSVDERLRASLARRRRAETRFRLYGLSAVVVALFFLGVLFVTIVANGWSVIRQTEATVAVFFDPEAIASGDFQGLAKAALRERFPEMRNHRARRELYALLSIGAAEDLRRVVAERPDVLGKTVSVAVLASDDVDLWLKGRATTMTPRQQDWLETLKKDDALHLAFNWRFFTSGDSREPELAGILSGLVGSFWMLLVTLALSFPIGLCAAVYLEEFAPRNFLTDMIEVNINNLAAVPSIVFGLLALAVFLNLFGLPRSAPLVGGMALSLMTLPTIIIAARAALKAVPDSMRHAGLALGASKLQVVTHHVLPLAMPGMLTGAIIGMAQALGETAPLLLIGMVAFIVDTPLSPLDPATALPVQIYLWADSPERAFLERMSAAIMVLLAFLIVMNLTAVILRRKFERRW